MDGRRWGEFGMVLGVLAGSCAAQGLAAGNGCASTPAAAIAMARAGQGTEAPQTAGYRVEAVRWDATQRQAWAVIRSCDHAERPTIAMLTDLPHSTPASTGSVTTTAAAPLAAQIAQTNTTVVTVHAGEVVRLWRADGQAHIELMATAEENGGIGAKVRLRLMTAKETDGQTAPPRYLAGIVRGPADVEMEQ